MQPTQSINNDQINNGSPETFCDISVFLTEESKNNPETIFYSQSETWTSQKTNLGCKSVMTRARTLNQSMKMHLVDVSCSLFY